MMERMMLKQVEEIGNGNKEVVVKVVEELDKELVWGQKDEEGGSGIKEEDNGEYEIQYSEEESSEDEEKKESEDEEKDEQECDWCKKPIPRGEVMMVDEEDLCKACLEGSDLYFSSDCEWKVDSLEEESGTNSEEEEDTYEEERRGEKDKIKAGYGEIKNWI